MQLSLRALELDVSVAQLSLRVLERDVSQMSLVVASFVLMLQPLSVLALLLRRLHNMLILMLTFRQLVLQLSDTKSLVSTLQLMHVADLLYLVYLMRVALLRAQIMRSLRLGLLQLRVTERQGRLRATQIRLQIRAPLR